MSNDINVHLERPEAALDRVEVSIIANGVKVATANGPYEFQPDGRGGSEIDINRSLSNIIHAIGAEIGYNTGRKAPNE